MDREGWIDMEFENKLNCGITEVIRTCNGCKWLRRQMFKSGFNPTYKWVCTNTDLILKDTWDSSMVLRGDLSENVQGYVEPPGFNGDMCPFSAGLERELKLNKILPK